MGVTEGSAIAYSEVPAVTHSVLSAEIAGPLVIARPRFTVHFVVLLALDRATTTPLDAEAYTVPSLPIAGFADTATTPK